jgi:hypothetical protein
MFKGSINNSPLLSSMEAEGAKGTVVETTVKEQLILVVIV